MKDIVINSIIDFIFSRTGWSDRFIFTFANDTYFRIETWKKMAEQEDERFVKIVKITEHYDGPTEMVVFKTTI